MARKFDGVIEAVRYKNGQVEVVRAFERRGASFSDHVLLTRNELLVRLKKGKKFVIGKRLERLAGTFEVQEESVQVVQRDGGEIIATEPNAEHDVLDQAPFF